jgi:hypothetical protein
VSDKVAQSLLNCLKESSLWGSFAGAAEYFFSFSLFLFLGVFSAFGFVEASLDGDFGFGFQPTKHKT